MSKEVWFRASDDRRELCCDSDSVAATFMSNDPSFVRIDGPEGGELSQEHQGPEPVIVDLSWMSQAEQIELAKTILGL